MTMGNPELFGLQFVKAEKKKIHNSFSIKGLWFLVVCHDSRDPLPFTVEKMLGNFWSPAGFMDVFFP